MEKRRTVIKDNWAFTKWTYRNKADDKMLFNHANDPDETKSCWSKQTPIHE